MLLFIFIIFALQVQLQCNSAYRYLHGNSTFHKSRKNELQAKNDEYVDRHGGGGAKSNDKMQGLDLGARGKTADNTLRKSIDEIPEKNPTVHYRSHDDPPKTTRAPLGPVFSNRLRHSKHKPRARLYPTAPPTPLAPTPPRGYNAPSRLLRAQHSLGDEIEQRKARLNAELAGPQMRVETAPPAVLAYASSKEEDLEVVVDVPDANLLDMAKAVGGHVPSMRYRNRLCSRHVLIPEGPKYDSHGAVYLPAYSAKPPKDGGSTHDYNVTHAPRMLLPKCCNCCKKSVLGCA